MKILTWILMGLGAFVLFRFLTREQAKPGLQTTAQRNQTNNAILDSYSTIMPPIAMLERVPLTGANLRMVDPIMPRWSYPNAIFQNGGP